MTGNNRSIITTGNNSGRHDWPTIRRRHFAISEEKTGSMNESDWNMGRNRFRHKRRIGIRFTTPIHTTKYFPRRTRRSVDDTATIAGWVIGVLLFPAIVAGVVGVNHYAQKKRRIRLFSKWIRKKTEQGADEDEEKASGSKRSKESKSESKKAGSSKKKKSTSKSKSKK